MSSGEDGNLSVYVQEFVETTNGNETHELFWGSPQQGFPTRSFLDFISFFPFFLL
jgi:hypothetical protein